MLTCVVPGCSSTSKNCRLSFFEIPVKLELRQKWVQLINMLKNEKGESSWVPRDRDVVCSQHFTIQEFKKDVKKKTLEEDALPSIFSNYPQPLDKVYLKNLPDSKNFEVSREDVLCRLCGLSDGQLISIFGEEGMDHNVADLIRKYLPIDIYKEHIPTKSICYVCVSALLAWHDVYQQIIRADQNFNFFRTFDQSEDGSYIIDSNERGLKNKSLDDENDFTASKNISQSRRNSLNFLVTEEDKENSVANVEIDLDIGLISLQNDSRSSEKICSESAINEKTFNYAVAHVYQCNICEHRSRTQLDFRAHIASHRTVKSYTCSICNTTFRLRRLMRAHIRDAHSNRLCKPRAKKDKSCFQCGREFTVRTFLNVHIQQQHWDGEHYICDVCELKFLTNTEYKNHIHQTNHKTDGCIVKRCLDCGLEFESRFRFGKHLATKHGSGLKCSVCGLMMKNYQELQNHEGLHPELRPHKCQHCGKNFKRSGDFKQHEKIHTGERPYVCEVCGKNFTRKHNMHLHRRSHFGEKPFNCAACNSSFSRMGDLRKHKQIHYLKSGIDKL